MSGTKCERCGFVDWAEATQCKQCGALIKETTDAGSNLPAAEEPVPDAWNMWKGVIVGVLTGVAFGLGGFLLLRDDTGSMGGVLFMLLPFAAGFAVATITRLPLLIGAILITAAIICFAILLMAGAEGWVCVLLASPIIAVGMAIGAIGGWLFRKHVIDKSGTPQTLKLLVLLLAPLFLLGANTVEKPLRRTPRMETFTTVLTVSAPPEKVWEQIKKVDSIHASKPLLLRLGLPVPVSCALRGEGVGSQRTCYFDSGYIEERVTEWNPPTSMKLEITEAKLPGRHWLSFKDASYEIQRDGEKTHLIRKTTIISRLYPAWYWRPLEGLGVESEHQYLFDDFVRRVGGEK